MPVYNGERYLCEAIISILNQTFTDFEFIIVDDGSQDGSAAIISDFAERDKRIRVVRHERNRGLTSARNSGIATSRGEFVAAMDHDDISLPGRIEKQADFLQSHPDIGLVGTQLRNLLANGSGRRSRLAQQHAEIVLLWIIGRTTVAGPTIMARRDALTAVGGYDESIRAADDKELFSRLYGKTRFANLPEALYLHRQHENQTSVKRHEEQQNEALEIRQRWLSRLWGEDARATICRLDRLYQGHNFSWREWWLLRREVRRLVDGMLAANIVAASDMPWIEAETSRRLETAMPRRWQMFLHWRRHHFGSRKREEAV